ncbi:MAG TPA: riboflavin synthase [Hydrogenispora sp.]|jgi:riboflavin synthase|nr:riboflavin synthase [Hydrogenispora sp.]
MFTGIVAEQGRVRQVTVRNGGRFFLIDAAETVKDLALGASVAVNGVCLTVTKIEESAFGAEATGETLRRTTLGALRTGDGVNLEPALRLSDRLGGHLVTGHIDGRCRLLKQGRQENGVFLEVWVPPAFRKYIIGKGSVALDGVSLTVAEKTAVGFRTVIIPHTGKVTTLLQRKPGDEFNLETDYLVKCVEALLNTENPDNQQAKETDQERGSRLAEKLRSAGFEL